MLTDVYNYEKNLVFLKKALRLKKQSRLRQKFLGKIYCRVSSMYFYLQPRSFFTKKELEQILGNRDVSLNLNTKSRENFIVCRKFLEKSFLFLLLSKIEGTLLNFWVYEKKQPVWFHNIDLLDSINSDLDREYSALFLIDYLDYDTISKTILKTYFQKYLVFLKEYANLLIIRSFLVRRTEKNHWDSSSLIYLIRFDENLFMFHSRLERLANVLLMNKSSYLPKQIPYSIKTFLENMNNFLGPSMQKALETLEKTEAEKNYKKN